MKNRFNKFWSDVTAFTKKQYVARPYVFWAVIGLIVLAIILGLIAIGVINSVFPSVSSVERASMPILLSTTTADPMRQAPSATPTYIPTTTPTPSNLWKVLEIVGKETVNGRNGLVVNFVNTSTGEIKKGQCQSPRDPSPNVGDIFVAEIKDGYILLSPVIAGTAQIDLLSKVQRFIFIP